MSLDLNLPGTILNAGGLPIAADDDMQIDGALIVWEPNHPIDAFKMAGLPNRPAYSVGSSVFATTTLENVAAAQAAALLGVAESAVKPYWATNDNAMLSAAPPTNIVYERSSKGALHVAAAQTGQSTFVTAGLRLPDAVKAYLYANPSHLYYVSLWYEVTRPALDQGGLESPYLTLQKSSGTTHGFFNVGKDGPQGVTSLAGQAVPVGARNTLGLVHERLANTFDGTALTNATTDFVDYLFGFGLCAGQYGDIARNKTLSAKLFRVALLDLTVVGKTYDQMGAIDDAMRARAFGIGGRYSGDTHTAVTSLVA